VGDNTIFIPTAVTDGSLVDGVRVLGPLIRTELVAPRSRSSTFRRILSDHIVNRWYDPPCLGGLGVLEVLRANTGATCY
jgi:fructose-1,6-bisphosphatase II